MSEKDESSPALPHPTLNKRGEGVKGAAFHSATPHRQSNHIRSGRMSNASKGRRPGVGVVWPPCASSVKAPPTGPLLFWNGRPPAGPRTDAPPPRACTRPKDRGVCDRATTPLKLTSASFKGGGWVIPTLRFKIGLQGLPRHGKRIFQALWSAALIWSRHPCFLDPSVLLSSNYLG